MLLKEILTRLCEGEFSDLALGYQVDEAPLAHEYGKLVRHVDMGLLELHKRFPLRILEVMVQQYEHISRYELHSRFSHLNTTSIEPTKYIIDSSSYPFVDSEFLCVESVYDEVGCKLPLNDLMNENSVFTSGYNSIQVMNPNPNNAFLVQFKAAHGNLDSVKGPEEVEVNLPHSHLEALLYYVASRVLAPTHVEESNNYLLKFEQSCNKLVELNIRNEDNTSSQHFKKGGWV